MGQNFYHGKRVLVTGHTGFKGSWLCRVLLLAGAEVTGYSLEPPTDPSLFELLKLKKYINSIIGDLRDFDFFTKTIEQVRPEFIFHLAAQPLVRESYQNPKGTYETNVMGTVNVCEGIRNHPEIRSFLNITTDKVYQNKEWEWGYRETDLLDGYDPYSNSKSCSELITGSYRRCFLETQGTAVSTARAGNVIGGGDFAIDRILPDCIRAAQKNQEIIVRHPESIRPYQHVLEPISAYLLLAAEQYKRNSIADCYNIGPEDEDCLTTGELVDAFCRFWGSGQCWRHQPDGGPHEASYLKLDCSKIRTRIGWKPKWNVLQAIEKTVEWTQAYLAGEDAIKYTDLQIQDYFSDNIN